MRGSSRHAHQPLGPRIRALSARWTRRAFAGRSRPRCGQGDPWSPRVGEIHSVSLTSTGQGWAAFGSCGACCPTTGEDVLRVRGCGTWGRGRRRQRRPAHHHPPRAPRTAGPTSTIARGSVHHEGIRPLSCSAPWSVSAAARRAASRRRRNVVPSSIRWARRFGVSGPYCDASEGRRREVMAVKEDWKGGCSRLRGGGRTNLPWPDGDKTDNICSRCSPRTPPTSTQNTTTPPDEFGGRSSTRPHAGVVGAERHRRPQNVFANPGGTRCVPAPSSRVPIYSSSEILEKKGGEGSAPTSGS